MLDEIIKSSFLYFNEKTLEPTKVKSADIVGNFLFSKIEFFVLEMPTSFRVCVSKGGELYSVWKYDKNREDGTIATCGEVISEFRKGYVKSGCISEDVELFVENPRLYKKKMEKKSTD